MTQIKYSILYPILPTSSFYLKDTLPLLLNNQRNDFEVIISINGPVDNSFRLPVDDKRVVVVSPEKSLSMNQHYEFILKRAKGEWVQMLGADDFVTRDYLSELDKAIGQSNNFDIFNWSRSYYFWNYPQQISPTQLDFKVTRSSKRFYKLRTMLTFIGMLSAFELPQLYTCSIVRRDFISRLIVESQGCFYHSIIPDYYSTIVMLESARRIKALPWPLTWVGTSSSSYGLQGRVYSDLEKGSLCNRHNHNRLHENIFMPSHSFSYESFLLLECLLKFQDASGKKKPFWRILLYASSLSDIFLNAQFGVHKHQLAVFFSNDRVVFSAGVFLAPFAIFLKESSKILSKYSYGLQVKLRQRYFLPCDSRISPSIANFIFASKIRRYT